MKTKKYKKPRNTLIPSKCPVCNKKGLFYTISTEEIQDSDMNIERKKVVNISCKCGFRNHKTIHL